MTNATEVANVVGTGTGDGAELLEKRESIVKDETEIFCRRSWYDRLSSMQRKSRINYYRCFAERDQ